MSPDIYFFAGANAVATKLYVLGLKTAPLTHAYLAFISTMSITILSLDVLLNRTSLSTANLIGAGLGLMAVS